ncbi:DUF262 domain-containing protein [Polaromonas sp.]|uniref:DUF262 domain-containing protein n=1 Tax=Polaromonas sp. TaxID=1869339 RepID=UPI00248A7F2F|nr:DUF262 domain-containing protein [Polaromonas sp.]MDI1340566.1 DUF262 domain-containing protein [Polaromonas sp.]
MTNKSLADAEAEFWQKPPKVAKSHISDEEIDSKYDSKSERIVTETNREKLQNFYDALQRPNYMDPRPFYQRRQRWSAERQSQLIESFLINIPIPPLFVYESKPNVYEVMDGQQRITAIKAFYSNELKLTGLERWPELNGRTYSKLPSKIKAGIDRRSISWITVLHESSDNEEDAFAIKQLVFERLNTGGVKLSHQEIRNALFAGPFNSLLVNLSRTPEHRHAWRLPEFSLAEETYVPEQLAKSGFYLEMEDIEMILRFFALRHAEYYTKGMRGFLDLYMEKARKLDGENLQNLGELYKKSIGLALKIFDELTFRPYLPEKKNWGAQPQKAIADAVLVALCDFLNQDKELVSQKTRVIDLTKQEFEKDTNGVLTGRGNTKNDVLDRIAVMRRVFANALNAH